MKGHPTQFYWNRGWFNHSTNVFKLRCCCPHGSPPPPFPLPPCLSPSEEWKHNIYIFLFFDKESEFNIIYFGFSCVMKTIVILKVFEACYSKQVGISRNSFEMIVLLFSGSCFNVSRAGGLKWYAQGCSYDGQKNVHLHELNVYIFKPTVEYLGTSCNRVRAHSFLLFFRELRTMKLLSLALRNPTQPAIRLLMGSLVETWPSIHQLWPFLVDFAVCFCTSFSLSRKQKRVETTSCKRFRRDFFVSEYLCERSSWKFRIIMCSNCFWTSNLSKILKI